MTETTKKKSTMATIAAELGVSLSTVSRAFNPDSKISDEVRQSILDCADRQGFVPNRAASRLSMREINVAVLFTDIYEHAVGEFRRGAADAYRELKDLKVNIEVRVLSEEGKASGDLSRILDEYAGFDGVVVSGFFEEGELAALNGLAGKTNLVLLQADAPSVPRLFASCHDSAVSSRMAAEFLRDCLPEEDRRDVVIFTGDRRSDLHRRADEAFLEAAKEAGLNVTDSLDMQNSPALLRRQLKELYEVRGARPDGIYITSGRSAELCRYLRDNGLAGSTVLVAFDVTEETADYLRQGVIRGCIYQNLYKQAKNAVTCLVRYLIGEYRPESVISPIPELILKSNLDFYLS